MADETITTAPASEPTTDSTTPPAADPSTPPAPASSATDDTGINLGTPPVDPPADPAAPPVDPNAPPADPDAEAARATLFGAPAEGDAYTIEGLPEGMTIDTAALEAVTPIFRELDLSAAGASKVAAVYAEKVLPQVVAQATTAYRDGVNQQVLDTRKEWEGNTLDAIKGTAELKTASGDKINFDGNSVAQVRATAARALDQMAPVGFREFLDESGLGQHPAMVAFTYQFGKMLAEDKDFAGGGGAPKEKTRTQKYYNR